MNWSVAARGSASELWPEIHGGRQPNGQCDHNNVISVFHCHFESKILRLKILRFRSFPHK